MTKLRWAALAIGLVLASDAIGRAEDARVWIEETTQGFQVWDGETKVLFYHREPVTQHGHTRAGYVHPLHGLDGEELTEAFPPDHRHHHGVFWSWHQLWVGGRKVGNPWTGLDHLVVVNHAQIEAALDSATLVVRGIWTSPLLLDKKSGTPRPIISETTRIQVYRAQGDYRYVDFKIELSPLLADVKLGGAENVKGYSGFTIRVKPPADMQIRDEQGPRDVDAIQTASRWAGVSGSFGAGKKSGLAILSHPSLAQFPPRWLLRYYGMQNVAYPGREPIALSAEQPLVIRHRLVIHRGTTEQARIADHQRLFENALDAATERGHDAVDSQRSDTDS